MKKTEFRVAPHSMIPGEIVIELWFGGRLIGTVTGADGPGVRVISKYPAEVVAVDPIITEVRLDPTRIPLV